MATKKPAKKKRAAVQTASAVELPEHYAVSSEHRKCGKSYCLTCINGPGHGPYRWAKWTEDGKRHRKYLGREDGRPVHSPRTDRLSLADQLGLTVPGTDAWDEARLMQLNGAWMLALLGRADELDPADPLTALGKQMAAELPGALLRHKVSADEWAAWMTRAMRDAKRKR